MPFKIVLGPIAMAWLLAPMVGFLLDSLATSEAKKWAQVVAFFVLLIPFIWSWLPQWDEWLSRRAVSCKHFITKRIEETYFKQPYTGEGLLKPIVFLSYVLIVLFIYFKFIVMFFSGESINELWVSMILFSGLVLSLIAYFFESSLEVFYHRSKK